MTSTKYSISAANRITGKSRTTITKHIRQGKLSCEEDAQGNKVIDASELIRVYGDDCRFDLEEGAQIEPSPKTKATGPVEQGVQQQLHSVQLQLDMLSQERVRERQQFEQQVQHLQEVLKQVQDAHNKALLMLNHRSTGGGEWDKKFQELEEKIANSATVQLTKDLQKPSSKEVLDDVKNHSFWDILWAGLSR